MATVLYWNVESFSENLILNTPLCSEYLAAVIEFWKPDILSIVEISTGFKPEGCLISKPAAAKKFLEMLRAFNPNYCLVPPITSGEGGRCEGVAVYYDKSKYAFIGPNIWPGATGPSRPLGHATLGTYPADWAGCLPDRELQHILGTCYSIRESQLAAKVAFSKTTTIKGKRVDTTAAATAVSLRLPATERLYFPTKECRSPYLTTFYELDTMRVIKLLSFHSSPTPVLKPDLGADPTFQMRLRSGRKAKADDGESKDDDGKMNVDSRSSSTPKKRRRSAFVDTAPAGAAKLAEIPEMTDPIPDNEVRLVVGDFNVSLFGNLSRVRDTYEPLKKLGYRRILAPGEDTDPKRQYVYTHLNTFQEASINKGIAPGYNYLGSTYKRTRFDAIDNILHQYGKTAGRVGFAMVFNPVAGKCSHRKMIKNSRCFMSKEIDEMIAEAAQITTAQNIAATAAGQIPPPAIDPDDAFKEEGNFMKIRGSSDHECLIFKG